MLFRSSWLLLSLTLTLSSAYAQLPAVFDSFTVERSDTLYFDSGRAELRPAADSTLRAFGATVIPDRRIYLTGHTDAVGSTDRNERLARRRAAAAESVLLALGWADSAIVIETFGERLLLAPTQAEEERNRRVTVDLMRPNPYRRLQGQITGTTGRPLAATLVIKGRDYRDTVRTDTAGRYTIALPVDQNFGMDVYAPGHFFDSRVFKVLENNPIPMDYELESAEAGAQLQIKELLFVADDTTLLYQSINALPRVLTFMQLNPGLRIEIGGHVDFRAYELTEDHTLFRLSVARANMVRNYLIAKGIDPDRMTARGYGNRQLRYRNPQTPEQEDENRRVEITVLEQ
jgi:outer membrane protein OmpA-like peptidoglycan-associated protein